MKILHIDGPYLAHRSYYAPYKLTTETGLSAKMLHSFLRTTLSLYKKFKPRHTFVAWESFGTKSWRQQLYSGYKEQRIGVIQQSYYDQLKDLQHLLYFLNIDQYYSKGNEADDVIATLVASNYQQFDSCQHIFSSDKDLMQLVDSTTFVYDGKKLYDTQTIKTKFRVIPEKIPDLLALWGDVSDNIEGLKGFGLVKAAKYVNQYGSIEDIPITDGFDKQHALLNKKLATLNHHCELETVPNKNFKTNETLLSILDKYHLNSIKKDLDLYKQIGVGNET
jgi:DNA polymerase-1